MTGFVPGAKQRMGLHNVGPVVGLYTRRDLGPALAPSMVPNTACPDMVHFLEVVDPALAHDVGPVTPHVMGVTVIDVVVGYNYGCSDGHTMGLYLVKLVGPMCP